jgi:hypothetical protein
MALVGGGLRATSLHRELAKRRTTRRRGNQQASFDLQIARSSERWATDQAHHEVSLQDHLIEAQSGSFRPGLRIKRAEV